MAAIKPNIAELVERMPATDKEKEALKPPPAGQQTPATRPKPEKGAGSKFDAPDPGEMEKICEEILAGGRDSLVELIGLIRDPASEDFTNYKAEYLCHCLTVHAGHPGRPAPRRLVIDTLASQVDNKKLPAHVRGFLVRELQYIGDGRAVAAVGQLLTEERFSDDAACALLAIKEGAAEAFRAALPRASGRARLVVLQALAALADGASANTLLQAVGDTDRDIRLAAVWGLARLGSPGSVEVLLRAAETKEPWERFKATQACLLLAENLAAAGKKAEAVKVYVHLRNTRTNPKERYLREATEQALEKLGAGKRLT